MLALWVGMAVLLAGGVADFIAENHGPLSADKLYAGSLGAVFFLLAAPLIEASLAHSEGPRARVVLWRAMHAAAALLSLATWTQLTPLFQSPMYLSGVSSRWEQLEPQHIVVPVGALVAAAVARRTPVPTGLRLRAAISVAAAFAALVFASVRTQTRAQPWALLDHLTPVMELPAIDRARGTAVTAHTGNLWVRRDWSARYSNVCDVQMARDEAALPAARVPEQMVPVGCGALTVRSLPVTGEYVVVGAPEPYRSAFTFGGATLARQDVPRARLGQYASMLAPPLGWVQASWVLLALGALTLLSGREARRWLGARSRWRAAVLGAHGALQFEDGSTAALSYGAALSPGPVVVLGRADAPAGAPFRDAATAATVSARDVRAGTITEALADCESSRDAVWLRLSATAWMALAPIAPYALFGLLL